jgi:hypothetical protein
MDDAGLPATPPAAPADSGGVDPFAAAVARGAMESASDRRAAAAATREGFSDIEVARLVCQVLRLAAEKLGLNCESEGHGLRELCGRLVAASRHTGKLIPFEYRLAWWLSSETHRFPF